MPAFVGMALLALVSGAQAGGDPQNCGTIVIPTGVGVSSSADISSFNPLFSTSLYNAQAAGLLYLGLIWLDPNHQIDWPRSLASAITSPDQGTTYLVTLRDWHWSDGVPVTTADIAYTFKLIKEMGTTYPGYGAGGMPMIIKSLDILDATHFRVVLTRKVNPIWFTYNGLGQLEPLPAHSWGGKTLDQIWQAQSTPGFFDVVDGPLMVTKLDVGLDAVFVPNPAYEGPKMHFDRLIFKFLEGDGAELQGVESGDLDMGDLTDALWSTAQHVPGVYLVNLPPSSGDNVIMMNFRNPAVGFFQDVRVRDAMADAIDQDGMIKLLFHGAGTPIYGPVPQVPPDYLTPAMRAGQFPVGYDPAKARDLLRAAGFTPGPDGVMQKNGARLSFNVMMPAGDEVITQMTEVIQNDLRAVGIEMKVRETEFNQELAAIYGAPSGWQAAELGNTFSAYPSGEASYGTGATDNASGYSDKTMDALIADSVNNPGLDGLFAYETYASAQQPELFFGTYDVTIMARDRIRGLDKFVDPLANYYPEQLYCTEGVAQR